MMWFFRHFWIFISYHIFLLNQVEGAIAIPPSNSAPLPLFCPSVCPSVCPSIGLLTTFSGFCTFADKSLGRNGIELGLGQRRAVVIIGRWLLPSLVDTGDICCHYWQHILVNIGIPIIKIRWSHDHLIFIMEIPIPGKTVFILRWGPGRQRWDRIAGIQGNLEVNVPNYYQHCACWWPGTVRC